MCALLSPPPPPLLSLVRCAALYTYSRITTGLLATRHHSLRTAYAARLSSIERETHRHGGFSGGGWPGLHSARREAVDALDDRPATEESDGYGGAFTRAFDLT